MKKFLIALLAIAVLFSFAACDNNSNGPSDDTVTGGVTEGVVRGVATQINEYLQDTSSTTDVLTILDSANAKKENLSADHLSYTISKEDITTAIPGTNVVATDVTLTVKGEMNEDNVTNGNGTQKITLGSYTYTVTAPVMDAAGNYETLKASISGALVGGSMTVTVVENAVTGVTITDPSAVLLPASAGDINATVGTEKVDSALLFSFLDNMTKKATVAQNRAEYDKTQNEAAEAKVSAFVEEILNGTTSNLGTALAEIFKSGGTDLTGVTSTSVYSPETGVATFILNVAKDADLTDDAKVAPIAIGSAEEVKIAAGTTLTVTLTPAALAEGETAESKWATESTAVTYSVTGDLVLTADASTQDFSSIKLTNVTGKCAGIAVTKADDAEKGASLATVSFVNGDSEVELTSGIAVAPMQVGPALDGKGNVAFTDVDVDFKPATV